MPEVVPLELTEDERDGAWPPGDWDYRASMNISGPVLVITRQMTQMPLHRGELQALRRYWLAAELPIRF